MLALVRRHLGDYPPETVAGALDEVIAILKSDLKDIEKKQEIESIVDRLSEADFN
jgi:hypothetical protein